MKNRVRGGIFISALFLCVRANGTASPYGVSAHVTRAQEFPTRATAFEHIRGAGIACVRSDFDWSSVQPDAGTWTFDHLDAALDDAEKAGIQLLPILAYSTRFANPAHEHLDAWKTYVQKVVERYQSRIPVWEVWNEQNIPGFWKEPDPAAYLTLLKASYETIKAVNPKLQVAVGGYAGVPTNYIDRLYLAGAKPCFDIMNVHPYSHPGMPEATLEASIAGLRAIMAKHGDAGKKIWFTEIGWPSQKHRLAVPGLLRTALAAARPGKKKGAWRILVLDDPAFSRTAAPSEALLAPELPENSRVQRLSLDALLATLDAYAVDAVILPFDESYPATGFDRLTRYVREGGTLVEFGGAPFYYAQTRAADGTWQSDNTFRLPDFRFGFEAWWTDKPRIPEQMQVHLTGPAQALDAPKQGFTAERFIAPRGLKEGDRFIPLAAGVHNGYTGTAAAVIAYNSDLKGSLILSAFAEKGQRGATEQVQAAVVPRAALIAFQHGIERFFWYEFQAPETDDLDQESHFGLVHRDFSPKPAYLAYKTLAAQRPAGSTVLDRPWKSADGTLYHPQWQRPDGRAAGAIWSYGSARLLALTFSSKAVTLTSQSGAALDTQWHDGTATCVLSVTDTPIYFTGGTLERIDTAFAPADALRAMVPNAFAAAAEQYRGMLKRLEGTTDQFPRRWENGKLVTIGPKEWTSGFFPGSLWYLYEYTQAPEWKEAALHYTGMLEQIRHFTGNHDIGFMLYCSFGNGLRLANPDGYKEVLLDGAAALCTRFIPRLGMIRSWDNYNNPVIIDNMMNLELLMWAAKQSGEKRFSDIALSHADQTDRRHFRPDGSAYHIVDYNPLNGKIYGYYAGQGASADAPWARGQSWGLYGFTMMYRETRKPEYLTRAIKLADFLVNHPNLPADKVPYWDYQAAEIPHAPRDSSAAAIMASALLELSTIAEAPKAARYRETAIQQLLSLSSPAYRAPVGENGNFILLHGVGHLPGNSEIDVPLNYGDYYFLEGLLRFRRLFQ
jgi:hypothetical protein